MGQVCFAQVRVEFKYKITSTYRDGELLQKEIRTYIEETTGKKNFDFVIYNFFYNEERNDINFELDSGREQHLEWQLEQVVAFFKRIEPDLLDFNISTWVSMGLEYTIDDLIDEL